MIRHGRENVGIAVSVASWDAVLVWVGVCVDRGVSVWVGGRGIAVEKGEGVALGTGLGSGDEGREVSVGAGTATQAVREKSRSRRNGRDDFIILVNL